jgi:hypothetical protein
MFIGNVVFVKKDDVQNCQKEYEEYSIQINSQQVPTN